MNSLGVRAPLRTRHRSSSSPTAFEVRGEWTLRAMPERPRPWMVIGRTYVVVLRRASPHALPQAEVRDRATDQVLASYSWSEARALFGSALAATRTDRD